MEIIGVIGGMGPQAGLDLVQKILGYTAAQADGEHLPTALLSYPGLIPERSLFLNGHSDENPADAITEIARRLDTAGATVAGIPCNTAHVPVIFDPVVERLQAEGRGLRLLHMIDEAVEEVERQEPRLHRVGVLSTDAVRRLGLYRDRLEKAGFEPILPDADVQKRLVSPVIFDRTWGVKAQSHPVSPEARQHLLQAVAHLTDQGAEAIILGCTELPLALTEDRMEGVAMIDPTAVLARALIRETYPEKLRVREAAR
ncbi:MAG: aspartate/glutamate racemase family protein [Rhodothermales bacterium]